VGDIFFQNMYGNYALGSELMFGKRGLVACEMVV